MRERAITAGILAPIVLTILFLTNPWPLICLGFLVSMICAVESWSLLSVNARLLPLTYVGFAVSSWAILQGLPPVETAGSLLALASIGIGCAYLIACGRTRSAAACDLSSLWFSAPLAACVLLHGLATSTGTWTFKSPLLLSLLPVWAGDIAAIFAGKAFGTHPLMPSISPKKTVEGAIANLAAATAVGALAGTWIGLSIWTSSACGLAVGILGQCGDLFESYVKRRADKKDSGSLLPGHGGILDRVDSLLFTAPAVALILVCFR